MTRKREAGKPLKKQRENERRKDAQFAPSIGRLRAVSIEVAQQTDITCEKAKKVSLETVPKQPGLETPNSSPVTAIVLADKQPRPWKWNKTKRLVLQMTLDGVPVTAIAKAVGKHRNTVRSWWDTPEFQKAMQNRGDELKASSKLRYVHHTQIGGEVLFSAMKHAGERVLKAKAGDPVMNRSLTELHRGMLENDRRDQEVLEGNIQRMESHVFIRREGGARPAEPGSSDKTFKQFLEDNKEFIPKNLPEDTAEAKLLTIESILIHNPKVLEDFRAEDLEIERQRQEHEMADPKNRRR